MTTVSIVIVNYNVRQFLSQCIDSIFKSNNKDFNIEIIIIDNASVDGSIDFISKKYPHVQLIPNNKNLGFSKANNQGIAIARGEYILILNPDTLIQEDTLSLCLEHMNENIKTGVLGVRMIDGSGKYLPESKRGEPTLWNSFTKFSGLTNLFPTSKLFSGYYLGLLDENSTHKVDVLCGAFMFFRKDVLLKCGGFDEDYFMYGEDIDLSLQVRKKGYNVIYLPTTKIIHFKGESTKKTSYNYVKNFYNAMKIFVGKNYNGIHGAILSIFLSFIIYLLGGLAFIKNIIKNNVRLLVDAALIFFGTQFFKELWATYYFHNPTYFNNLASYYNNIGIVIIYSTFLWFFGQYDNYWRLKRLFFGVLISFILSSIIYALLPLNLRSSRILLIISATLGFFIPLLTLKLFQFISKKTGNSNDNGNYLIVSSKENSENIKRLINDYDKKNNILGFINPDESASNNFFLNNINNLSLVAKTMKADKIVLCNDDLDNQTLLNLMVLPDSEVNYLIVNVTNSSVLESNDKNSSGRIFVNHSSYKLSQRLYLRLKRLLDIFIALTSIFLFPILVFYRSYRETIFSNLLAVLFRYKTWVGYTISTKEKMIENNLPIIKNPVISNESMINNANYFPTIKNVNEADIYYAKNYNPIIDLELIFNFIFKR